MVVHGEGYAAAHVADDQVLLLIHKVVLATVALSYLPLVQGVPDSLMGHLGQTGDACHVVEFIYDTWVNGKGATSLDFAGYAQRYQ